MENNSGGLPPKALLESTHTFPGPYVFKVIGNSEDGFLGRVVALAREASGATTDPGFSVRQSSGGKHVAITLTCETKTADDVLKVYAALSKVEGLVLLM